MIRTFFLLGLVTSACLFGQTTHADTVIDFNELDAWTFSGASGSYYNGNSGNGSNSNGWTSGSGGASVYFGNEYNSAWGGFWNGFAYSNVNDPTTADFTNQYAAITGTGFGGGGNYAVGYAGDHAFFDLPTGQRATSIQLTNTTYAGLAMEQGDSFSKKFGGASGNDPDYFLVTLTGYSQWGGSGDVTGSLDFYLADYRFADNSLDYIIRDWTEVNLSVLGHASSIRLTFEGSDMGSFGLNTPAYVALDHLRLTAIPEPHSAGVLVLLILVAANCRVSRRIR